MRVAGPPRLKPRLILISPGLVGGAGDDSCEFQRTVSRLNAMQSAASIAG